MEDIPEWAVLIGNVGFPVLLSLYLLIRFEKRIDGLIKVIRDLQSKINNSDV
ncbi:YvrJ protein family protein [Pelagirhabdus alkalitolerans]|uniref:YvrJ protein family protein n=1 Tax=Pelagirhabdus alkalitolerans TaxID=1612202 RepID=A0A1G6MYQ2_9BACI|nr:YvrJ family protein [Pelagirhabdus alkalitolerans]SDC60689.1 YvrJ protein family protein [Pelagirhabdus alkalitolerans]